MKLGLTEGIWGEKPEAYEEWDCFHDVPANTFVYSRDEMDAWLEKLRVHYESVEEKAKKWDELCDPMKPFATTGDFGAEMQRHYKFTEAKNQLVAVKKHAQEFGWITSDELAEILGAEG